MAQAAIACGLAAIRDHFPWLGAPLDDLPMGCQGVSPGGLNIQVMLEIVGPVILSPLDRVRYTVLTPALDRVSAAQGARPLADKPWKVTIRARLEETVSALHAVLPPLGVTEAMRLMGNEFPELERMHAEAPNVWTLAGDYAELLLCVTMIIPNAAENGKREHAMAQADTLLREARAQNARLLEQSNVDPKHLRQLMKVVQECERTRAACPDPGAPTWKFEVLTMPKPQLEVISTDIGPLLSELRRFRDQFCLTDDVQTLTAYDDEWLRPSAPEITEVKMEEEEKVEGDAMDMDADWPMQGEEEEEEKKPWLEGEKETLWFDNSGFD